MRLGAIFPQTEIGDDPVAIRDWAQAAEGLGYDHILAYDHIIGADIANRPGWRGPYTSATPFHEIFVLFGYLAAVTRRVELATGVVILPLRQTVLVAKQAAAIDLLCGGRLRLGVGVGWDATEYVALNEDFGDRGARIEEQIAILRALWTEPAVTFDGRWHTIQEAGINPLPLQRPIPIWLGGIADAVLGRVGRLGDGWLPYGPPDALTAARIARVRDRAAAAGRDPAAVGIEGRITLRDIPESDVPAQLARWRALGATHCSVNFLYAGVGTARGHIAALGRLMDLLRSG